MKERNLIKHIQDPLRVRADRRNKQVLEQQKSIMKWDFQEYRVNQCSIACNREVEEIKYIDMSLDFKMNLKKGYMYMYNWITCCTPETSTTLLINYCCCCLIAESCLTLCRLPPDPSVHGIFQARILAWVVTSYSRGSSWPRNPTHISCVSYIVRLIL